MALPTDVTPDLAPDPPTARPWRESLRYAGLTIEYDARVLQPRPWTVLQSRWAAEIVADAPEGRLLELCSGAGHIGLAAAVMADRSLTCVDVDPVACYFTRLNAEGAGLEQRVEVREARLEDALDPDERFVLAIADPPWVRSDGVDVHPGDPLLAIDGGADGLDLARACVDACLGHLAEGGSLLVQLGDDEQAAAIADHAAARGWAEAGVRHGPTGRGLVLRLLHPASTTR